MSPLDTDPAHADISPWFPLEMRILDRDGQHGKRAFFRVGIDRASRLILWTEIRVAGESKVTWVRPPK